MKCVTCLAEFNDTRSGRGAKRTVYCSGECYDKRNHDKYVMCACGSYYLRPVISCRKNKTLCLECVRILNAAEAVEF